MTTGVRDDNAARGPCCSSAALRPTDGRRRISENLSAISRAEDPVVKAEAIRKGVEGGLLARAAGRIPRRLFAEVFPVDAFEIVGFGNVLACAAFLYGLAPDELSKADLDAHDPFFPVVYGIRAVKPLRGHISSDGSTA